MTVSGTRSYKITDELGQTVCAYVKAGGFPRIAAEAAGIPAAVFDDWLRLGGRKGCNPLYRRLKEGVRQALAQARLAAEVEVYRQRPESWLRHGLGRETAAA